MRINIKTEGIGPTKLPNFLIIGANKAGTTSIHNYLDQHPDVFMSRVKEPMFFALAGREPAPEWQDHVFMRHAVTRLEDYQELFRAAKTERAVGESSTAYLPHATAAENIRRFIPGAKLIAVLRDPAHRAYSQYLMNRRLGFEPLRTFEEAVEVELGVRPALGSRPKYLQLGMYYEQLKRYFENFAREQILVLVYRDFKRDPNNFVKDIYRFLEINDAFVPAMAIKHNTAEQAPTPRNPELDRFLSQPHPVKRLLKLIFPAALRQTLVDWMKQRNTLAPRIAVRTRAQLIGFYREDVLKTQDLIGRDLSFWLR